MVKTHLNFLPYKIVCFENLSTLILLILKIDLILSLWLLALQAYFSINGNGKVVFWASYPNIIAFSKPNNGKYENQLLIWKVLSFLCTLSRLHLLCPNCLSVSPAQHHPNLNITLSHLEAFSHLSSLLKTQSLSFQFRNPNSKLQDDVKMRLSARLGPMGVQENSGKTKWSLGGESGYPKTKTLTSKCVLDSQICVQDSSTNKK